MSNPLKLHIFFLLYWLFSPRSEAHDTIFVNHHFEIAAIASRCDWTYDASRKLKPYKLANEDLQWQPHDADFFNIQNEGRYWLRFSVYNQDSIPSYLHLSSTSMEVYRLQLYVVSPSGIDSSIVTGSEFPVSARPLQNSDLGFRLLLYSQQYYTCYVYLERDATPVQTSLLFYDVFSRANMHSGRIHRYRVGFIVGVAALYGIIAILILCFFPQTLHAGYVLYTLGGLGYLTASHGMGIDILWSEYPYFGAFSEVFFATLLAIGLLIMSRVVLQTPIRYKYINKLLVLTIIIGILYILIGSWRYAFPLLVMTYSSLIAAITLLLALTAITMLCFWNYYRHKEAESLWFFSVFGFVIIFAIAMLFTQSGVIPRTEFINGIMPQLVVLVEATLATLFVTNRIKNQLLARQQRELTLQRQRQRELERISRDLHDEVGSTLSSIAILSEATLGQVNATISQARLMTIIQSTKQVMDAMSDIVWSVDPKNDYVPHLLQHLKSYAIEILEAKNIQLHFDSQLALEHLPTEQRKEVYLIFKEAINNAAKYAAAKNVWVNFQQVNNCLKLTIRDDGKGFDPATIKRGNGLNNMEQRATQLGGNLSLKSNSAQGVEIQLVFSVSPNHGIDRLESYT